MGAIVGDKAMVEVGAAMGVSTGAQAEAKSINMNAVIKNGYDFIGKLPFISRALTNGEVEQYLVIMILKI